jgi:hypothetical protein
MTAQPGAAPFHFNANVRAANPAAAGCCISVSSFVSPIPFL